MVIRAATVVALLAACLAGTGCGTPPRSTRLAAEDLRDVAAEMAARLRTSAALVDRDRESPRWVITIDRVENLSSDVIPLSEQWWLIERVRSSLPLGRLSEERNIVFVIPAERLELIRRHGEPEVREAGTERRPTHRLGGTFRSITRFDGPHRTELYAVDFDMIELDTGEQVWADTFAFKRMAYGRSWD